MIYIATKRPNVPEDYLGKVKTYEKCRVGFAGFGVSRFIKGFSPRFLSLSLTLDASGPTSTSQLPLRRDLFSDTHFANAMQAFEVHNPSLHVKQ